MIGSEINTVRSVSDVNSVFGLSLLSFFGIEFSFEFFRDELSLSFTWELNNPTYFFLFACFLTKKDRKPMAMIETTQPILNHSTSNCKQNQMCFVTSSVQCFVRVVVSRRIYLAKEPMQFLH